MTNPSTAASDESSPMPPAMQAMIPMELLTAYVELARVVQEQIEPKGNINGVYSYKPGLMNCGPLARAWLAVRAAETNSGKRGGA